VSFFQHPYHQARHKEAVAGGTALYSEEPLPQEFHMTQSGSFESGFRQLRNGQLLSLKRTFLFWQNAVVQRLS
jgi:hypothetical protein